MLAPKTSASIFCYSLTVSTLASTGYFKNTKKTASTRQAKAARWFHCMACQLNTNIIMMVNTVSEITS